jgi:hypothetical protein
MPCKEFSINLAVLAPNNNQQLTFGVTKGCNPDDSAFFIIDFVFRDRQSSADDFQDRVKLHVEIGAEDHAAVEKMVTEGLSRDDLAFLAGPVTRRSTKLPPGTTQDAKVAGMVKALVDQHAPA